MEIKIDSFNEANGGSRRGRVVSIHHIDNLYRNDQYIRTGWLLNSELHEWLLERVETYTLMWHGTHRPGSNDLYDNNYWSITIPEPKNMTSSELAMILQLSF
jgi:hypothetical protein